MARLIDADALVNIVETARKKAKTLTGMDFVMVTKDAPTIDAIPVEWLLEKYHDQDDSALSYSAMMVLDTWKEEQEAR